MGLLSLGRWLLSGGRAHTARDATIRAETAHHHSVEATLRQTNEFDLAVRAVTLLGSGLGIIPPVAESDLHPNVLAGQGSLSLAHDAASAALHLLTTGYYAPARALLRLTFEASAQAQVLAKEPSQAEPWMTKNEWWSHGKVRNKLRNLGKIEANEYPSLGRLYGRLSASAHPTKTSALTRVTLSADGVSIPVGPSYSEATARVIAQEIAGAALYGCLALQDAVVHEGLLPSQWRRDVKELAEAYVGRKFPELERDWTAEDRRLRDLISRMRPATEVDTDLRANPNPFHNLSGEGQT